MHLDMRVPSLARELDCSSISIAGGASSSGSSGADLDKLALWKAARNNTPVYNANSFAQGSSSYSVARSTDSTSAEATLSLASLSSRRAAFAAARRRP